MTAKQFLNLHKVYENKYRKLFFRLLQADFKRVAEYYEEQGEFNSDLIDFKSLESLYHRLYLDVMPTLASEQHSSTVMPMELRYKNKDFFDVIASLLNLSENGVTLESWRLITQQWYNANILTRITMVQNNTIRIISKIIQDSLDAGNGVMETARRIRESTELNQSRALTIARTETIAAMNKGRVLAMHASNLEWEKKWVDTHDDRTRFTHRVIARQEHRDLDVAYDVPKLTGGIDVMMYPGDPNGSAGNVINCRCTEIYRVKKDELGMPVRKRNTPKTIEELVMAI